MLLCFRGIGDIISDCTPFDLGDAQRSAVGSARTCLEGVRQAVDTCRLTRLGYVCSEVAPQV